MKAFFNTRHSAHFWVGWLLLAGCIYITATLATKRPKIEAAGALHELFPGTRGKKGLWKEKLPHGEYTITCESSESDGNIQKLFEVEARYVENRQIQTPDQRILIWHITAPSATHEANGAVDILDGPLSIQVKDTSGTLLGSGKTNRNGPALRRENDVWTGLAPLHWTQLDMAGKGEYHLPSGWRKEANDWFVVERGPVIWNTAETGPISRLTADSLYARDINAGVLNNVEATLAGKGALDGGQILAERVEVAENILRFLAPLTFGHKQFDWKGTATEGVLVRPETSGSSGVLELKGFSAKGLLGPTLTNRRGSNVNIREARADRAKWSASGLMMEGDVRWNLETGEKNRDTTNYLLRSPRAFYRNAPGDDLPKNLAVDSIRSEGNPVLSWKNNTLSSVAMIYFPLSQTWHLEGPVYGTVLSGSFSSKQASGTASRWVFNGNVRADYMHWGTLRGEQLVWDDMSEFTYTFTGSPAVLTGLDRRLSGKKIIYTNNRLQFPSGIQGNFNFQGETLSLRSDKAEIIGYDVIGPAGSAKQAIEIKEIHLVGSVECSAQSYRLSSKEMRIIFDNRQPRIIAEGGVSLQGTQGSGFGDALQLRFERGKSQPLIDWSGKVRGKVEVPL